MRLSGLFVPLAFHTADSAASAGSQVSPSVIPKSFLTMAILFYNLEYEHPANFAEYRKLSINLVF